MQLQSSEAATIVRIGRAHGATEVRLFGSRAMDAATDGSDIDLLVTMEAGRSLLDLVAIKQDVEDALGMPADVVTQRSLSPLLRERVFRPPAFLLRTASSFSGSFTTILARHLGSAETRATPAAPVPSRSSIPCLNFTEPACVDGRCAHVLVDD